MGKTTIKDIAEAIGIAPSTVSRAFSNSPLVKESTKQIIFDTAKKMNYSKNAVASNLRKGKVNIVGIIVPRINRQFFSHIISSAEIILNKAGYSVLICQSHETLEKEIQSLKTLINNRVAAIFISHSIESKNGSHILNEINDEVDLIQFDRAFQDLPGTKIINDNYTGAYKATEHLIKQGYKKVGHIAGYMNTQVYQERVAGYKQAILDAEREVDENLIFYDSIITETGRVACEKALKLGCDALYSAGDFSALGAIQVAEEHGLKIPEEFGIVGTANEDFTAFVSPKISSLALCPQEIGKQMAQTFLDNRTNKKLKEKTITIKIELIKRDSSLKLKNYD